MQYIVIVGAQLIGEEPRLELCRYTAIFAVFYYQISYPKLAGNSTIFAKNVLAARPPLAWASPIALVAEPGCVKYRTKRHLAWSKSTNNEP